MARAKATIVRGPRTRISLTGCAPKDLKERKAEWELEVEPPPVRENSTHLCALSAADHVAINVFHLAAAGRERARCIDDERLPQRRKVVGGSERRWAGKGDGFA